jgi:hypothetical protein
MYWTATLRDEYASPAKVVGTRKYLKDFRKYAKTQGSKVSQSRPLFGRKAALKVLFD